MTSKPTTPRDSYWIGSHWRLLTLTDLGVTSAPTEFETHVTEVSNWLARSVRRAPLTVAGLPRARASVQGNAVGALCRLGLHDCGPVADAVAGLLAWQWPDGGWNCDSTASGRRSSFHETLGSMWGLFEYAQATGDWTAGAAARAAAELILDHDVVFRGDRSGPIRAQWLKLAFPSYWHYGLLSALVALDRMDLGQDPRAARSSSWGRGREPGCPSRALASPIGRPVEPPRPGRCMPCSRSPGAAEHAGGNK